MAGYLKRFGKIPPPNQFIEKNVVPVSVNLEQQERPPVLHGEMEINGIRLAIDPSSISITEQNYNHTYHTLRTKESIKVRSGYARMSINVSAFFTGVNRASIVEENGNRRYSSLSTINSTLMPILYSLKKFPLCFVENELIRRALPVSAYETNWTDPGTGFTYKYLTGENIGLFLNSVNISTVEGMPETLQVNFSFTWYNHRPFAHSLRFRKNWIDAANAIEVFRSEYKKLNDSANSNAKTNAVVNPTLGPVDEDAENAYNHSGRQTFLDTWGHPSTVFNATTKDNQTGNIHHSRPFAEWMWPYKYESTNPATFGLVQKNFNAKERPFNLTGFDRGLSLEFTTFQHPQKIIVDGKETSFEELLRDFNVGASVEDVISPSRLFGTKEVNPKRADGIRAGVKSLSKEGGKYKDLIYKYAKQEGIPPEVLMTIIAVESGGNPNKENPHTKAAGLGQLVPSNWASLGVTNAFDPEQNIKGSAKLLARLIKASNGNPLVAAWKYNRGEGNVAAEQRVLAKLGLPTDYPQFIDVSRHTELDKSDLKAFGNLRGITLDGSPVNKRGEPIGNSPAYLDKFQVGYSELTGAPYRVEGTPSQVKGIETIRVERARAAIDEFIANFDEDAWSEDEEKFDKALEIRDILDRMEAQNSRIERNYITGKVAEIKNVTLEIPQGNSGVIPISMSVGFGNSIVTTPLEGHRFPTAQYIGGQNTVVNLSLRCEGAEGRAFYSDLIALQNASENGAISFREFSKKRPVAIYNPLINSINIFEVFIEDISVDTIQGSPDGLFVNIRFLDATLNTEGDPLLNRGAQDSSIDETELKMLSLLLDKNWIEIEKIEMGPRIATKDNQRGVAEAIIYDIASIFSGPQTEEELRDAGFVRTYTVDFMEWVPEKRKDVARHDVKRLVAALNEKTSSRTAYGGPNMFQQMTDEEIDSLDGLVKQEFEILGQKATIKRVPLGAMVGYGGVRLIGNRLFDPRVIRALIGSEKYPGAIHTPYVKATLGGTLEKLVGVLGIAPEGGVPLDPDFAALALDLGSHLSYTPGHEAYPDLHLPPNPITGLTQDMTPDFFLYNESDIKFCKTPALELLTGDIENTAKGKGLLKALYAIGSCHEGIQQVYGIKKEGLEPGDVGDVTLGPDGAYLKNNDGEYTTVIEKQTMIGTKSPIRTTRTPLAIADYRTAIVSTPTLEPGKATSSLNERKNNTKGNYNQSKSRLYHSENKKHIPGVIAGTFSESVNNMAHVYDQKEYKRIFTEFSDNYQGDHLAIRRSFPTFKVFFIDEEGEVSANSDTKIDAKLFRQVALDDFYGVNAIKSIRIIEQKNMAASSCIIEVLDIDGILYNRKYLEEGSKFGARDSEARARRTPFSNTVIKEGMKVMVKFGYSNDPDQLETKFIGQIAQFEGNHLVEIICQSYGTELVAKKFGTDASDNAKFWNSYTDEMLHDCMDREELRHFGRWRLQDISEKALLLPDGWHGRNKLRPDGQVKKIWSWKPSVVDDNIFAPDRAQYLDRWDKFFGNLNFVYWDTTIWDVFKECELRHPGYIAYPAIYGDTPVSSRMTMFFGNPSMEYLARPASNMTELEGEITQNNVGTYNIRQAVIDLGKRKAGSNWVARARARRMGTPVPPTQNRIRAEGDEAKYLNGLEIVATKELTEDEDGIESLRLIKPHAEKILKAIDESGAIRDNGSINSDKFWKATMVFQQSRMKTFRNYELATSLTDIVANNIKTDHRDTFNSIELRYSDGSIDFEDFYSDGQSETVTINADDNIQEHHIRRGIESWINCTTGDLSRRYASQLLANSLKRTYKGELILLGKPQLKPYDILWIHDAYSDMAGPIEIDEVVHSFSAETGFMTEVVPSMIVAVKEEVTTLLVDAVGAFFTETIGDFTDGLMLGASVASVAGAGRALALTRTRAIAAATKVEVKAGIAARAAIKGQEQFVKIAKYNLGRYQKAGLQADQLKAVEQALQAAESRLAYLKASAANGIAKTNAERAAALVKLNNTSPIGAPQIIGGAVAAVGGVGATGATVGALNGSIDEDQGGDQGRGSYSAGVLTGVGAGLLFMWVPFIAAATAVGAGYAVFKFIKSGMTREPLIITPLLKQGKPFVTGIDGYESDGLVIGDLFSMDEAISNKAAEAFIYKKWRYYGAGISDALDIMQAGYANLSARR